MKFSIVTITYNASEVLQPTLDSVAQQTFKGIEHFIVDGVSTDDTLGMAEAYRTQNRHEYTVRVSCEPDKGIYDAMNKGLQKATGDYVVFLNAGDRLATPNTLYNICKAIEESSAAGKVPDVVYGDTDLIDSSGSILGPRHLSAPKSLSWQSFRNGMLVCHQAFYVRRQLAANIKYDMKYRFSADVDWCIRVLKQSRHCLRMENKPKTERAEVLALYLKEGTTTKNHRASLKERFRVMASHYGLLTTVMRHVWFVINKKR